MPYAVGLSLIVYLLTSHDHVEEPDPSWERFWWHVRRIVMKFGLVLLIGSIAKAYL
jgi:hypothetical protein